MLFNSIPFIAFIVLFFSIWPFASKHNTSKWLWIWIMSLLFYGWWDWRFLFLLLGTGTVDYYCGKATINSVKHKFKWLWVSLGSNILSLLFFKYSFWICGILDTQLHLLGIQSELKQSLPEFSLILPIGISFYTFNSISYTIDLYRGKAKPAENILHFFAFISFFPHLVAGPIIRARDILSQLSKPFTTNYLQIFNGLQLCLWGLFQKMVLADNIALRVNDYFKHSENFAGAINWWTCMLCFAFQIYFDFNGYSTVARGLAKLCGIHFKLNFRQPYFAYSFANFWQRWHISLSLFFRDYVYIPLGGNRRKGIRNIFNLLFTFLISGLWHGANLTYIVWGGLHGLYLLIERFCNNLVRLRSNRIISGAIVFIGVLIAWVFFRAANINEAFYIIKSMFSFTSSNQTKEAFINVSTFWLFLGIGFEIIIFYKWAFLKHWIIQSFLLALMVIGILFFRGPEQQFIYFQF
jgi:alginate O-acetyltransferase complex protein AlgI